LPKLCKVVTCENSLHIMNISFQAHVIKRKPN
jgi:hypothetical protein